MADEITSRNQAPQFHYTVRRNRFFQGYHQPTSGSQGSAILKWLHEDMESMDGSPHFKALERSAVILSDLGQTDPHPMLYSQVIGAFEALMDEWRSKSSTVIEASYDDGLTSLDDWNADILGGKL